MNKQRILKQITRLAVCLSLLLAVSACNETNIQGQLVITNPKELCIKGVVYYSLGHGKTPAYKKDGSLMLCDS